MRKMMQLAAVALAIGVVGSGALAQNLRISTGLPDNHYWVAQHMNGLIDTIKEATGGAVTFTTFYDGKLIAAGRELDALNKGSIDVAAPLLAPYDEGRFPLSDVTQLPTYGTDSPMVTRAFQKLLDSDVKLAGGKTFYDYEIGGKGIHAWAVGATSGYSISTTGKKLVQPSDFSGLRLRGGSTIHTIVLNQLGATPVNMPAGRALEAMSRGTVDGGVLTIPGWRAYAFQDVLKYTVTDVAIGHWQSYLAISDAAWNKLTPKQQQLWDETARRLALANADHWEAGQLEVVKEAAKAKGAVFVPVGELPPAMQNHISKAAAGTWIAWVEKMEAAGHPGKAAAKLYAQLITTAGGRLPQGVAQYLGM